MANYTSIILFVPAGENLKARLQEINSYKLADGRGFGMVDVNTSPFPDIFPRFMLCGAYKEFDLIRFIRFLKEYVNWEEPEHVKLIAQDDYSENVDLYDLSMHKH